MAGTKRPSFLKRQKEQKRMARAQEKREARLLKKRGGGTGGGEIAEPEDAALETDGIDGIDETEVAEGTESGDEQEPV